MADTETNEALNKLLKDCEESFTRDGAKELTAKLPFIFYQYGCFVDDNSVSPNPMTPDQLASYIYQAMVHEARFLSENLPIYTMRFEIVNAATTKKVFIVEGDTGCGKSTQIPQFFFTSPFFYQHSVYVTEPRRFAAESLANKVRKDCKGSLKVHSCVNWQDFKRVKKGSLVFFKESFFLNMLMEEMTKDVPLADARVVVIDEIHEYSIELEILLEILIHIIRPKRPDLSVVITSATLDITELQKYLSCVVIYCNIKCHEVKLYYLGEIDGYVKDSVDTVDKIIIHHKPKTILVFLATVSEILSAKMMIQEKHQDLLVLLLHGKMGASEQDKVLECYEGTRVVLCTNFAESSITVPNVTHVIDSGREKFMQKTDNEISEFKVGFISKASATQRKGRAGRQFAGYCFRMYTQRDYEYMEEYRMPKLLSVDLQLVLLKLIKYKLRITDLKLLHCPSNDDITEAMNKMLEHEQIEFIENEYFDFRVTDFGEFVMKIDLDPELASLIYRSEYRYEIITLACILKTKDNFYDPKFWCQENTYLLNPSLAGFGDFIFSLFLVRQYSMIRCEQCIDKLGYFPSKCPICRIYRSNWAFSLNIIEKSLHMIYSQIRDLLPLLPNESVVHFFTPEQERDERELANIMHKDFHDHYLLTKVIDAYSHLIRPLGELLIESFRSNINQRIFSNLSVIESTYLNPSTNQLSGISPSSIMRYVSTAAELTVCLNYVKSSCKVVMNYVSPLDPSICRPEFKARIDSVFDRSISEKFKFLVIENIGFVYFKELRLKANEIEKNLKAKEVNALVNYNKEKRNISIIVENEEAEEAEFILRDHIKAIRNGIHERSISHASINMSFSALIGFGCSVLGLVGLRDELIYRIKGFDPAMRNYEIIKELKKSFMFNFANIERFNDACEVKVYFQSRSQAQEAQRSLNSKPIKGLNGSIYTMENMAHHFFKGKKVKLNIPLRLTYEDLCVTFNRYNNVEIGFPKYYYGRTEVVFTFQTYNEAEFFAFNFRACIREHYSISASSHTILTEGVFIPKDITKHNQVEGYIEEINYDCLRPINLNKKRNRIYCDFNHMSNESKDRLLMMLKNDTVEAQFIIWREIYSMVHYYNNQELTWFELQNVLRASCVYHSYRKVIIIWGIPYCRRNAVNYLRKLISELSQKIKCTVQSYDKTLYNAQFWQQAKQEYPELEIFVEENQRKVIITGLENNVDFFLSTIQATKAFGQPTNTECKVCYQDMGNDSFELFLCGHVIHKTCFIQYIENNFGALNKLIPVSCIYCKELILYQDLLKICSVDLMKRIEKEAVNEFMIKDGKEKYAWCENVHCYHLYDKTSLQPGQAIRYCSECELRICLKCAKPAYANHNFMCEKDYVNQRDSLNKEWVSENCISCPKCRMNFEKSGGCNHVTCPYCSAHFCFVCFCILPKNVMDHYGDPRSRCYQKYFANNLR